MSTSFLGVTNSVAGAVTSQAVSSVTLSAGSSIMVLLGTYEGGVGGGTVTSVTDSAGNTYTKGLSGEGLGVVDAAHFLNYWYVTNCLAINNGSITVHYGGASGNQYSFIAAYGNTSNPQYNSTDVSVTHTGTATTSPVCGPYSTNAATESLFLAYYSNASTTSSAVNSSYSLDAGTIGSGTPLGSVAHKDVSSIITNETVTLTSSNVAYSTFVVSMKFNSGLKGSSVQGFREFITKKVCYYD